MSEIERVTTSKEREEFLLDIFSEHPEQEQFVWFRPPYGHLKGYYFLPMETARDAWERTGYETKIENGILYVYAKLGENGALIKTKG